MRVITWNCNSVRARLARVLAVLSRHAPDVLCLQETKATDDVFPLEAFAEIGYHAATFGQKAYNGVALLSRTPATNVTRGFGDDPGDDPEARLIAGTFAGIRIASVYVPNGATVGSDAWLHKLQWLTRLREWLDREADPSVPWLLAGDFNVAPADRDCFDPEGWAQSVLCHPDARASLALVTDAGLVDLLGAKHPEGGIYTWWHYRAGAARKNHGLRIDHLLASESLAARCTAVTVDREERLGDKPSDHAPVIADFRG